MDYEYLAGTLDDHLIKGADSIIILQIWVEASDRVHWLWGYNVQVI